MILVAVGANLAAQDGRTSYQLCTAAVDALGQLPGLRLAALSLWYRSAPVPRSDQPDYVNGVVRLEAVNAAEPDPAALLAMLQQIEQVFGRERSVTNAARTLDLDIIAMGAQGADWRHQPDPILPHPRAAGRAFVLLPLREVAPEWVHPGLGLGVDVLIDRLPAADLLPAAISVLPLSETRAGRSGPAAPQHRLR